jgi:hypothetical protein
LGCLARPPAGRHPSWTAIPELVLIIGPLFLVRFLDHKLEGSLFDIENQRRWTESVC